MSEETIPEMRDRIKALEKQVKDAETAASDAASRARLFEAKDAFREAGYNPKHAQLFVSSSPEGEITPELVATFADEFGLAPLPTGQATEESKGENVPDPTSTDANLSPLGRAGSRPGEGGAATAETRTMTHRDWMELNRKNPSAAKEALQRGEVEINEGNFYARQVSS